MIKKKKKSQQKPNTPRQVNITIVKLNRVLL